ncbi:MAG: DUF2004 domain-containing protein [Thermoplasmataceae archaeon]
MAKNVVKISFQINHGDQDNVIAEAISNLAGNEIMKKLETQWKISHVTLGEHVFFRTEYAVEGIKKISREVETDIRSIFDSYARLNLEELTQKYGKAKEGKSFRVVKVEEVKEEYNLWQDKLFGFMGRQGNT